MEEKLKEELQKLIKKEKRQASLTNYITKFGKFLLYILPLILLVVTVLALIFPINFTLTITFIAILILYGFNSFMLFYGALITDSSLKLRLELERRRGRPIDSLDGFDLLYDNVNKVISLLKIISYLCFGAIILYTIMLLYNLIELGFAAIGFALVGLGLALLIRSLNLKVQDINGLQDFYKPTTHQIFLDNFFGDIFSNHLDPVTFLKWDEYLAGINAILTEDFIHKIKAQEEGELPITFAIEQILYLYYLKYQNVLSDEIFTAEIKEIINVEDESFDVEKGLFINGVWYYSKEDLFNVFAYVKEYNPGFFNIIDRVQLELTDNIERIANDPIYMDSSCQEVVYLDGELNIMVFLYNNFPDDRNYKLRVIAPGFEPNNVIVNVKVEGRGTFEIPTEKIPLTSREGVDICGVVSNMLENGDTVWITLEPRQVGEQTVQIFLETEDGVIIEGKTRAVKVTKDIRARFKKLTSIFSLLGGIAAPVGRVLLPILIA